MRALAEFIMKGRTQAVLVAVLGVGSLLFAWVSAAAVALVTLRKGTAQGGYVLFWALLPALAIMVMGQDVAPLATLLGTTAAAVVLRQMVSWQLALLVAVLSGLATAVMMMTLGGAQMAAIQELLQQFAQQVQQQAGQQAVNLKLPSELDIAGMIGLSNSVTVVVCLLLGRWWQAMLYNPGGFQQEFHQLRLAPTVTIVLLLLLLLASAGGSDYRLWGWVFLVPVSVAGLGLVHGVVKRKGWSGHWLTVFYVGWLLFMPVRWLLVAAAVADSWIDFRKRLSST